MKRTFKVIAPEPRQYPELGVLNPGDTIESEVDLVEKFPGLFEPHKTRVSRETSKDGSDN